MKHNDGPICNSCSFKLQEGHEKLTEWFNYFKEKYPEMHTSCVYRGKEDQDNDYKTGVSKLQYPDSYHNKTPSQAIDIFTIVYGKAIFDVSFYSKIWDETKVKYPEFEWGGNFPHLRDYPQFQITLDASLHK